MFKITKEAKTTALTTLNLHGRFTAEYIPEVEKALNGDKRGKVALDLTNVTFVDRSVLQFLCRTKLKKIRIENPPSYVARWIEQEAQNRFSHSEH
jgi:anti-anti-sigma regulatory factor